MTQFSVDPKIESIGFTSTREGMTSTQKDTLMEVLFGYREAHVLRMHFHHGDCVGGDYEAGEIAIALNFWVVIHPPKNERLRAFSRHDEARPSKEYNHRNHDIVTESGILIACPKEFAELPKGTRGSGTWSTYHHAIDAHKPTLVIWPDGSKEYQENKIL